MLEVMSLEVATESVGGGTQLKSWRERVPDFRSCDAEDADPKWSANKWNR